MLLKHLWKTPDRFFSLRISASSAGPSGCMHLSQYVMLISHQCSGMPWLRELHRLRWKHTLPQGLCWNEEEGPQMAWHYGQRGRWAVSACHAPGQLWKTQERCFSLRISVSSARPGDHVRLPQYVMLIPCQHWSAATVPGVSLPLISAGPWGDGSCNFFPT